MLAQIVYESIYGSTSAIAKAIAEGLAPYATVRLDSVEQAPMPDPLVDLLVVGGPTHGLGLSTARSRREFARRQSLGESTPAARPVSTIGIRDWLAGAEDHLVGIEAAAFCTRLARTSWLPSSAADGITRRLRSRGCRLISSPEEFLVDTMRGPLRAGEDERAHWWGASLAIRRQPGAHAL